MSWTPAPAIATLLQQINEKWPGRAKQADGIIGNDEHAARKSDHNPNAAGVVTAMDITNDPLSGPDSRKLAEVILATRDPRIKYIISNGQIASSKVSPWQWRPYHGPNGHFHHMHISVMADPHLYGNPEVWKLDFNGPGTSAVAPEPLKKPALPPIVTVRDLRKGMRGDDVKDAQTTLGVTADGIFGEDTEKAVKAAQVDHDLRPDGIIGPQTREALGL